jgi:hypothetical protein
VSDLLQAAFSRYKPEEAYESYLAYDSSGTPEDLAQAVELALPVAGNLYQRRRYRRIARPLLGAAATRYFRLIKKCEFKDGNPGLYRAWLEITASHCFIAELWREHRVQKINVQAAYGYDAGKLLCQEDADVHMTLERLPELLVGEVMANVRFDGSRRKACLYILDKMLRADPVSPNVLQTFFDVSAKDAPFLLDYMTVRLRIALQQLKEEAAPPPRWYGFYDSFVPEHGAYQEA